MFVKRGAGAPFTTLLSGLVPNRRGRKERREGDTLRCAEGMLQAPNPGNALSVTPLRAPRPLRFK